MEAGKDFVTLEELAAPYSRHLTGHLEKSSKQGTSGGSRFLDVCRQFNEGRIDAEALRQGTMRLGFNNVIDAFHIVNQTETARRFFVDERKSKGGITLTDELASIKDSVQHPNLGHEVEARWRLVETAWSLDFAPRLLMVQYDEEAGDLYVRESHNRRVDVTSCRAALNGYQKGKCFYCFADIILEGITLLSCDVDHFFPHSLSGQIPSGQLNLNGVWNLVLSCASCNRGKEGKFALVPVIEYLERLHQRNNYLIESHHPLRETLMQQTGETEEQRQDFLQQMDNLAISLLLHRWPVSTSAKR